VTENPEIVWNDNARNNVTAAIHSMKRELYYAQKADLSTDWRLPSETFQVDYGVPGELTVGGIYLRLYVTNPSWNLRKPREFFRDLLEFAFSPGGRKTDESLELVGTAIGHLLRGQPHLCDALPPMGHLKGVLAAVESDRGPIKRAASIVLLHIASNHACVEALCALQSIQPIVNGMKKRSSGSSDVNVLPLTCEAINHLYAARHSELVFQGIQSQLVPLLLSLLKNGNTADMGPSPSATKAHIVKALQSMSDDERFGAEIQAMLSKSDIWAQYRDQKHDLFLSDKPVAGYLTSSGSSVSGYLTQGSLSKNSIPTSPPPLIE
jgi:DnaJ family protein C protein 13